MYETEEELAMSCSRASHYVLARNVAEELDLTTPVGVLMKNTPAWQKKVQRYHNLGTRPDPTVIPDKLNAVDSVPDELWVAMDVTKPHATQHLLSQPVPVPESLSQVKNKPGVRHTRRRGLGGTSNVPGRRRTEMRKKRKAKEQAREQSPSAPSGNSSPGSSCDSRAAPTISGQVDPDAPSGRDIYWSASGSDLTPPRDASDDELLRRKKHALEKKGTLGAEEALKLQRVCMLNKT